MVSWWDTKNGGNKSSTIWRVTGLSGGIALYFCNFLGGVGELGGVAFLGEPLKFLWECMVPCLHEMYTWMGKIKQGNSNQTLLKTHEPLNKSSFGLHVNPNIQLKRVVGDIRGHQKCAKCCTFFRWLLFGDLKSGLEHFPRLLPQNKPNVVATWHI